MSKTTNHLFSFLVGATAGVIAGLLYAPFKGKHLRAKLSYELSKYKDKVANLVEEMVEGKEVNYSEAKSEGEKVINKTRTKAEQLLSEVSDMMNQSKR